MLFNMFSVWKGDDVFVIGGGPSLKNFDTGRLIGKHTIGCNDAYLLGEDKVSICHFGDSAWFHLHEERLRGFKHPVVNSLSRLFHVPWLYHIDRYPDGFHRHSLGWNGNTGASAINLALLMGASRIFLLGFDMKLSPTKESNWHPNPLTSPVEEIHYQRYKESIHGCLRDLSHYWPEVEVVNLNVESALESFPRKSWDEVFGREGL